MNLGLDLLPVGLERLNLAHRQVALKEPGVLNQRGMVLGRSQPGRVVLDGDDHIPADRHRLGIVGRAHLGRNLRRVDVLTLPVLRELVSRDEDVLDRPLLPSLRHEVPELLRQSLAQLGRLRALPKRLHELSRLVRLAHLPHVRCRRDSRTRQAHASTASEPSSTGFQYPRHVALVGGKLLTGHALRQLAPEDDAKLLQRLGDALDACRLEPLLPGLRDSIAKGRTLQKRLDRLTRPAPEQPVETGDHLGKGNVAHRLKTGIQKPSRRRSATRHSRVERNAGLVFYALVLGERKPGFFLVVVDRRRRDIPSPSAERERTRHRDHLLRQRHLRPGLPKRKRHACASRTADDGSLATLADGTDHLPRRVAGLAEEPRKRVVTALGRAPESAHLIKQLAALCRLARAHDFARDRPPIQRAHLILDGSLLPPLSRSDEGALDALKRTHIIPRYIGLLGQECRRYRARLDQIVVVHPAEDGLPLNLLAVSPNRLNRHVDLLRELAQLGLDIGLGLRSAVHG